MAQQIAKLNYLRIAPRKVRLVADAIKGLSVNDAEAYLLHQRRRPAKALLKLLRSAVSNAKNNQKVDTEHFCVQSIRVDQGPMLKRHLPRARGSASPIQKKMSNVLLILAESKKVKDNRFKIVIPKKIKDKDLKEKPKQKKQEKESEKKDIKEKTNENAAQKRSFFRRKSI